VQIQEGGTGSDQRGQIQSLSPGIDGKVSQWDKLLLALFRETVRELVQDDQGSGNPAATGEELYRSRELMGPPRTWAFLPKTLKPSMVSSSTRSVTFLCRTTDREEPSRYDRKATHQNGFETHGNKAVCQTDGLCAGALRRSLAA
jgi:hypothetical protein